jgi:hypothetical protein
MDHIFRQIDIYRLISLLFPIPEGYGRNQIGSLYP